MMSRAQLFGEIQLTCGPSGAGPEGGLSFTSTRLNLFIGPNNAGKSLLLRELSGAEPRRDRKSYSARRWLPGKLVSRVDYGPDLEGQVADEVKDGVLRRGDEVHDALRQLPWRDLLRNLEEGEASAVALLAWILEELERSMQAAQLPPGLVSLMKSGGPIRDASGLMALLLLLKEERNAALASWSAEFLQRVVERGLDLLAPLGLDLSMFRSMGPINVPEILQNSLRAFAAEFSKPLLPGVADPTALLPPDGARLQRLVQLSPWALNPQRWAELREELERRARDRSWGVGNSPALDRDTVLYLDGLARLQITDSVDQRRYNPALRDSAVSVLLDHPDMRRQLRAWVHDALGLWLVVDMVTDGPRVHLRLSASEPQEGLEQRRDQESAAFLAASEPLSQRSDGIHAYIGILAAILSSNARLVFIDEPEAFLHPPLARILGRQLADLARRRDIQIFIATHSPDLLAGCVASEPEARVVRLSYLRGEGRAWSLDSQTLRSFTSDPRLRSAAALAGLFTQAVVIGEGDSDRVFYQEIFERLNESTGSGRLPRRAEGWTFTNLQNWNTEHLLLGPLRQMGVPAVAIVDRDVLFTEDTSAMRLLRAAGVPEATCMRWRKQLAELRPDGAADPDAVETIISGMARYGVFVVPVGAVEDWFTPEVPREPKKTWVERSFNWLGLDPNATDYRDPEAGGVWAFMRAIAAWVDDPRRLGMDADHR